jgi:hypothetical protein
MPDYHRYCALLVQHQVQCRKGPTNLWYQDKKETTLAMIRRTGLCKAEQVLNVVHDLLGDVWSRGQHHRGGSLVFHGDCKCQGNLSRYIA